MVTRQTGGTGIAVALLALVVGAGVWYSCSDSRRARAEQPKDTKLKELLKERHATLKDLARQMAKAYQGGGVPIDRLHETERAVLVAEFDLCDTERDRAAVLEKIVALSEKQEEGTAEAVKSGAAPASASLRAKVNRLEAEIALERSKSK